MTKRLVDIDDQLLADARELTGAPTMKATIHRALAELIAAEQRRVQAGHRTYDDLIAEGLITPASAAKRSEFRKRVRAEGTASDLVADQRQ